MSRVTSEVKCGTPPLPTQNRILKSGDEYRFLTPIKVLAK
jgi:hypothetical protein